MAEWEPDPERDLWVRQRNESGKAFDAFRTYRDMGPGLRSQRACAAAMGKSTSLIRRWSVQWHWQERVEAWDEHADALMRERDLEEAAQSRTRFNQRIVSIGTGMVQLAEQWLKPFMLAEGDEGFKEAKDLQPSDVARLLDIGTKLARLGMGEATERTEMKIVAPFVRGLIEVAMRYVPEEARDAFLADLDNSVGMSTGM